VRATKWMRLLALGAAFALVGAACGDDDDTGGDDTETDGGSAAELDTAPGFDGTTIRVGALGNTGAPLAAIGVPLSAGNRAYFE
jgi:hypothetical protein